MIRLGERLSTLSDRTFVGRATELALFQQSVLGHPGSPSVIFVHGPGGIGKSALLHRFATVAAQLGRSVVRIDSRQVDPSPAAFDDAVALALRVARPVLLVDGFEWRQGLEGWLRDQLLPRMPEDVVVVVAGRRPPSPQWRADPSWIGVLKVLPLRDLSSVDAATLLRRRGVDAALHEPLLRFAGGHPLALCLAAKVAVDDVTETAVWTPTGDVIGTLLTQLLGELPSPAHRHALEVCAHALATTEELLRAVLPEQASALFEWLRRQPFIEAGEHGIYPHDVVRDALEADLLWRDPEGYATMHSLIRRHLSEQAKRQTGPRALQAQAAVAYLLRKTTAMSGYLTWQGQGEVYGDAFREEDRSELLRMARETEGERSAALVDFWLDRQPAAFTVYRRPDTGVPTAFMAWLRMTEPVDDELVADPVLAAAWRYVDAKGPLREGEHAGLTRFKIDPVAYNRPSPVMDLMLFRVAAEYSQSRGLAWSFSVVPEPEFWVPMMDYLGHMLVPEPVQVGDHEFTLFAHDWRTMPVDVWVEGLGRLGSRQPEDGGYGPLIVLGRSEFDAAVRAALRGMGRRDLLASSPLLHTRLVAGRGTDAVEVLRQVLVDAVGTLDDDSRLHRAVTITYLQGDVTQERAAEKLGVSLSSYKRHLARGTERITEWLWRRELDGQRTRPAAPAAPAQPAPA